MIIYDYKTAQPKSPPYTKLQNPSKKPPFTITLTNPEDVQKWSNFIKEENLENVIYLNDNKLTYYPGTLNKLKEKRPDLIDDLIKISEWILNFMQQFAPPAMK